MMHVPRTLLLVLFVTAAVVLAAARPRPHPWDPPVRGRVPARGETRLALTASESAHSTAWPTIRARYRDRNLLVPEC